MIPTGTRSPKIRPRMLVCYICGREYGTSSLKIHQPQCVRKYKAQQKLLPKHLRKSLPKPVVEFNPSSGSRSIDNFNEQAFQQFDKEVLVRCNNCGRTFKPESLIIHNRSCTPDKPAKPVPGWEPTKSQPPINMPSPSSKGRTPKKKKFKSPQKTTSPRVFTRAKKKKKKKVKFSPYDNTTPTSTYSPKLKKKKKMKMGTKKRVRGRNQKNPLSKSSPLPSSSQYGGFGGGGGGGFGGGGGGFGGGGGVPLSSSFSGMPKMQKPSTLFCYLCGREFGLSSLSIHIPQCKKKYKSLLRTLSHESLRKKKVPKMPVSPLPSKKIQKRRLEAYNTEAYGIYMEKSRVQCPGCNRKLAVTSMENHLRGCSKGNTSLDEKEWKKKINSRPRMLICYICGREYGSASLPIHQIQCKKKWKQQQMALPPEQRRSLPRPPRKLNAGGLEKLMNKKDRGGQLEEFNNEAFRKFKDESLQRCRNCGRTFLQDRLVVHQKSCTAENPARSVSSSAARRSNVHTQGKKVSQSQKLSRRVFKLDDN